MEFTFRDIERITYKVTKITMVISILRIIFCETCSMFNSVEATLLVFSILSSGNKMETLASIVLQDRQPHRLVLYCV